MDKKKDEIKIPQHKLEAIARCLLPDIISFFESEEGKKDFEKWKLENDRK